ncbi:hypothetical protein SAMN05216349_1527 [Oribacterium sp. KHPX15]|uniref:hypothetical protein n=1 Tax=Oribacterium sp. KHPX15 TaxID=1855342 RepID=UPI000898B656|nr:hypothetical protein [Oribacterium sp. KHPX15]SEA91499.1 hypothetical protein SAMN05216349_1527 [Oribacterium sp. KHPX15]
MKNGYIFKFINSGDIRKYLFEIGYQFSVAEYAYLIWQCGEMNILQKHEEFKRLIDSTETTLIKTSMHPNGWDLHQIINKYISLEKQFINRFFLDETGCFYECEWFENGHEVGGYNYYSNYTDAYSNAMKNVVSDNNQGFHIYKRYIDNSSIRSSVIDAVFNATGEMIDIDLTGNICEDFREYDLDFLCNETFTDMWFDIPIPFKQGDIVCDKYRKIPFVITSIVPWCRKEKPPRNNKTIHLTGFDMCASGYTVNDNLSIKYNWLSFPYLNLEYYSGDLNDELRILSAYSLFKKGTINGDTLVKLTQLFFTEYQSKKLYKDIDCYMDENTMKKLAILKYKESINE